MMTFPGATQNQPHTGSSVWRVLGGVLFIVLGLFVCGAAISWSPFDPSLNIATDIEPKNLFGPAGAIIADLLMQGIGLASILGGICLILGGVNMLFRPDLARFDSWIWGSFFILGVAAFMAGLPKPLDWALEVGAGGLIGAWLHTGLAMPFVAAGIAEAWLCSLLLSAVIAIICAGLCFGAKRSLDALRLAGRSLLWLGRGLFRLGRILFRILAFGARGLRGLARLVRRKQPEDNYYALDAAPFDAAEAFVAGDEDEEEEVMEADEASPSETRPVKKPSRPGRRKSRPFALPTIDFLKPAPRRNNREIDKAALMQKSERLQTILREFGVKGRIIEIRPGPVVTLFEFEPAPGVKSSRVISLADDIARSMSVDAARVAVVPGRNAIGVELPNEERETVYLRSLLSSSAFSRSEASLPLALGENIGGEPVIADLAKMPHLLIAGTTGSGKSVGVNAMILSLIFKLPPDKCRFIMIDPKMLELSIYEGIPHLLAPVVIDPQKAVTALKWVVAEMERRYEAMSHLGVRNIDGFNARAQKAAASGEKFSKPVKTGFDKQTGQPIWENRELDLSPLPNIVVVIDEMADLMIVAGKDVEALIQRLAQMARAAGIHLITATQRPSVDVITGTIKANFPTRISYMLTTKIDSRTILGEQGAEQLLGMGDLLYQASGGKTIRVHGPFVSDEEVDRVVKHLKAHGEPEYIEDVTAEPESSDTPMELANSSDKEQDLYLQAVELIRRDKRASTSYVQRRLKIGYNRAASLIERMEEENIITAPNHAGKREVLDETGQIVA